MNNVIHFRSANSPRRVASGGRGGAQILFFTGVRYQRWSEEANAPEPQPQTARRKRQGEMGGVKAGRKSRR